MKKVDSYVDDDESYEVTITTDDGLLLHDADDTNVINKLLLTLNFEKEEAPSLLHYIIVVIILTNCNNFLDLTIIGAIQF
jgi:hypothetical protein